MTVVVQADDPVLSSHRCNTRHYGNAIAVIKSQFKAINSCRHDEPNICDITNDKKLLKQQLHGPKAHGTCLFPFRSHV